MLNTVTGPRHARCGIAVNGLSHNMIAVDIGQLLHNIVQILLCVVLIEEIFSLGIIFPERS